MDNTLVLSTVLGVVGITGQLVATRNPIAGWTISLGLQPLWYAFYIAAGGWGLLPLSTGYGIAAALHLRKALHERGASLRTYPLWLVCVGVAWLRSRHSRGTAVPAA